MNDLLDGIAGILFLVGAGCGVFLLESVCRHMPTRWLKVGLMAWLIASAMSLCYYGIRLAFHWIAPEWLIVVLGALKSLGIIIVFLCLTGKLSGTRSVFLVEDDPADAEIQCKAIREAGFKVVHAASGAEALLKLDRDFVIAFVDLSLGGRSPNGLTVINTLRSRRPSVPIVVLTGDIHSHDAVLAAKTTQAILQDKPLDAVAIKTILQRHNLAWK